MLLRLRGPSGQATLSGIENDTAVSEFLALVAENTDVPVGCQEILAGFPPKPLDLTSSSTVADLGIQNGDSLTVRQASGSTTAAVAPPAASPAPSAGAAPATATATATAANNNFSLAGMSEDEQLAMAIAASLGEDIPAPSAAAPPRPVAPPPAPAPSRPSGPASLSSLAATPKGEPAFEPLPDGTAVVRRIVADDNSCLFSAVGYVAKGTRAASSSLRSVVAEVVLSDPFEWNEAVLGKDPAEYARWITDPRRWGGAIELSILSKNLGKEIAAFDIQTQRVDVYGQGEGYTERVMVVYDGLHYDALAVAVGVGASETRDVLTIPTSGSRTEEVMVGASRLVAKAHAQRQFTDTANFTLRCGTCKIGLRGEKEAVEHAKSTGHQNFTEY